MKKHYLLAPGPTPIPESVLGIFAQPIIHHRTPGFQKLFEDVQQNLKYVFQTQQEVLVLSATGTGAMEAALSNLFSPGDSVIVVQGGKFGERWAQLARVFGLEPQVIRVEPGYAIQPQALRHGVEAHPQAKAILFQASETSTGVQMPTQEICQIAREAGMLSVCDAITACGVFDLPMDRWGIDVLITGSQKAMMIPPGLAMIALSERAWAQAEISRLPKFYFDLKKERKAQKKGQTAWTPAISLIQGLHESLRLMREEGLEGIFARHALLAKATRAGVEALGLTLFAQDSPSPAVSAVRVPPSIPDGKKIPSLMRNRHGVTITGGQDELEGKIFRLSHFGYCGPFDITTGLAALELVLHELGHPLVEFGKGVGAALRVFSEADKK
ncbi:MAG: pyridoxal-phosphate-dependent aminotransferase family protein [Bdellovibrionia bacterium]